MPEDVSITGGGLAACCCAALLSKAGVRVSVVHPTRTTSPVLMLSEQTQLLLRDVFGIDNLLEGATRINRRIVAWGQSTEPAVLPHSGLIMRESTLLGRLWPMVRVQTGKCESAGWNVGSVKDALSESSRYEFGSRLANVVSVELNETSSRTSCWIESLRNGWLFLIPSGGNSGSLIAVGESPKSLLEQSALVAPQIAAAGDLTGSFPAYPSIITPLCRPGWIACGTAAIGFDPIAGEGAGNAIREGILASALIRASFGGECENDLLAHYSSRILSGFLRHLQVCRQFYEAVSGPWWQAELDMLIQGISWTQKQLASIPARRFALRGFELERLGVA
jgi:flavin-dependent dehydrogenase